MDDRPKLLTGHALGGFEIGHRVVLPGALRLSGAEPARQANQDQTEACRRRATKGGLLISEPIAVAPHGIGLGAAHLLQAPWAGARAGKLDLRSWCPAIQAVQARGGRILAQLWHAGRLAHSSVIGAGPVGASSLPCLGPVRAADGALVPGEHPRPLDQDAIDAVIGEFRHAALQARQAGFDGVELNAADGSLPDQFLQDGSNDRTDRYGGSRDGRMTFALEVLDALVQVWGADRVGIRLSPLGLLNDMRDSAPMPLFTELLGALNEAQIAFVHLVAGGAAMPGPALYGASGAGQLRAAFRWSLIVSGDVDTDEAVGLVAARWADAVGFADWEGDGPALLARLRRGA
jgi:N-ethylmaleimide reductase